MRALIGILASLLILSVAAPLGAGKQPPGTEPPPGGRPVLLLAPVEKTLTTAPLGRFAPSNETFYWVASLVNVGSGAAMATIEFCDEAGACGPGDFAECSAVLLGPGKGCSVSISRVGAGLWYARMLVSGIPPINVRGALQFQGALSGIPSVGVTLGVVEAQ